jgi:hypothetical protein
MWLLIAEIGMLLYGVYTLFTGKIRFSQHINLEGRQARIVGLFLISPIPLLFVVGIFLVSLIGSGILPESAANVLGIAEYILTLIGSIGAYVYGRYESKKH